jgi:hypothetical protein
VKLIFRFLGEMWAFSYCKTKKIKIANIIFFTNLIFVLVFFHGNIFHLPIILYNFCCLLVTQALQNILRSDVFFYVKFYQNVMASWDHN